MRPFVLEERLSESTFAHAILLDSTVDDIREPSVVGLVYWRWEDEPDMQPQFLGEQTVGSELSVPFENPDRRAIHLYMPSKTKQGNLSVQDITQAKQVLFNPPLVPYISEVSFDSGTDDVTIDFVGNGGEGDIYILRKIDDGDFAVIATVDFDAVTYVDSPIIDGTYSYKLTQENVTGESNTETVEVDVDTAPAGSPPSSLGGTYNGTDNIALGWTNNGGTGPNIIEVRIGLTGLWTEAGNELAAATSFDYGVAPSTSNVSYRFRVRNESVAGYSNETNVVVPKEFA